MLVSELQLQSHQLALKPKPSQSNSPEYSVEANIVYMLWMLASLSVSRKIVG